MIPFSFRQFYLVAHITLSLGIAALESPRCFAGQLTEQQPVSDKPSTAMLGVNTGRTRAYDIPSAIQPKAVLWKTGKLFVLGRSYPFTLTFEGMPGMSSTTILRESGHGFTEPVISDGTIYFSLHVNDGYIFAQHTATGGDRWRFKFPAASLSPVAVARGAVFSGASNGTLFALDSATGQMLWEKVQKGNEFYPAAPLVADEVVYFSSTQFAIVDNIRPTGRIIALDRATGKELWVYQTRAELGAPAFENKTLFVGDSGGYLHALDAATGKEHWKAKSSGGAIRTLTVKNGVVYYSVRDGSLHAVDGKTGEERWKITKGLKVATLLALDDAAIYFGGENFSLFAVDVSNGQLKWSYKTSEKCHSPVLGGGVIWFTTGNDLRALDAATGTEKWKVTGLEKPGPAPILGLNVVYLLVAQGHLYAFK